MADCRNISVNVEYIGLLAKLAGTGRERFTLGNPATLKELLEQIAARHPKIDKLGDFFIAVNRKKIKYDIAAINSSLEDGDFVTVGVNVIGG